MGLRDEIREQPDVVARLVARSAEIEAVARAVRVHHVEHVVIAARGTSDHAAIYAQYLFGIRLRLPVALAAPSIVSLYHVEPVFARSLVIGISQSGASPDVVGVVDAARRQGQPTIAITNEPGSALAQAAEHVIDLGAGPERAVAATKTYTAELAAIALLVAALGGEDAPAAVRRRARRHRGRAREPRTRHARRRRPTRRGASARCWDAATSTRRPASGRSSSRSWRGSSPTPTPRRTSATGRWRSWSAATRCWPWRHRAPSAADLVMLLREIREDFGADLVVVSDREDVRAIGQRSIPVPAGVPDHLAPIVSIVPAQLFAYHATRARGLDPDAPRHISKVTLTT